jgi:hypothetical protein
MLLPQMPKVVPSLVVQHIASAFPMMEPLRANDAHDVAAIVALVNRVPEENLSVLNGAEYTLVATATAYLESAVRRWRNIGEADAAARGGLPVGPLPLLGNRHPLSVLRDLLERCPDDAPSATVPTLAFLADAALADVLRLDMSTAHTALGNGEFKAACVMAGSVVEALLIWALKRKPTEVPTAWAQWRTEPNARLPGAPPADWIDWKLYQLIGIAGRLAPVPLLSAELTHAVTAAKDFRNMIHPERADKTKPTMGAAHIAVGVMTRVAEEFEALVAARQL